MRLAHITDLHVERTPKLADLLGKRALGAVNLYVLGRSHHFSRAVQEALPAAVLATNPDRILCTGDLTATATDAEFTAAKALLEPLRTLPFDCIPGNHDVYTDESVGRYARHFGDTSVRCIAAGPVALVLVDVCRPDWLSRGRATAADLVALDAALAGAGPCILGLHYPLRDRRGAPYGPAGRALENAAEVEAVIEKHLNILAILHGHEHHGYTTRIPGGPVIHNPGSSGYAFLPRQHRAAHFNVYEVDGTGIVGVERYAWTGERFEPEAGGAYASGG